MATSVGSSTNTTEARPAAASLGFELMRMRLEQGLSLRAMARLLGMSAHSGLVDYERGHRVPTQELLRRYEHVLCPGSNRLALLHRNAMVEQAGEKLSAIRHVISVPKDAPRVPEARRPTTLPIRPRENIDNTSAVMYNIADLLEQTARLMRHLASE